MFMAHLGGAERLDSAHRAFNRVARRVHSGGGFGFEFYFL